MNRILSLLMILAIPICGVQGIENSRYMTAYACEGTTLQLECDEGQFIQLIRANYGRFSITICNDHGNTDWSVNCMSPRTLRVLSEKCSLRQACSVDVRSDIFSDPCPGTHKYIEAHYACVTATATPSSRPRPPWFITPEPNSWLSSQESGRLQYIPKVPSNSSHTERPVAVITSSTTSTTPSPPTTTTYPTTTTSSITIRLPNDIKKILTMELEREREDEEKQGEEDQLDSADSDSELSTTPLSVTQFFSEDPHRQQIYLTTVVTPGDPVPDEESCQPVTIRGLYWPKTPFGKTKIQPCPGGLTGYAEWGCGTWDWSTQYPNLSQCKSVWLKSLESRLHESEGVVGIASDLAQVIESKQLYGGDVQAAAFLLRKMASQLVWDNQGYIHVSLMKELVQAILKAGSHLLSEKQRVAWLDLSTEQQRQAATALLVGLEENAFLLADVIQQEPEFVVGDSNILLSVQVLESQRIQDLEFPSEHITLSWSDFRDVSIVLPAKSLLQNVHQGVVKVACFAYNNIQQLLQPNVYEDSHRVNSTTIINTKIVSASLGQGRHIQLPEPVIITFRHLITDNVSQPVCVFWDYTTSWWSGEGCRLSHTNRTHTVCLCDHLTNFAVLMDLVQEGASLLRDPSVYLLLYICGSVTVVLLALSLLTLCVYDSSKKARQIVHRNLAVCLTGCQLLFMLNFNQVERPVVCGIIAGVLEYFLLTTFCWLAVEVKLYHHFLTKETEPCPFHVKCMYALCYGVPGLIVVISCIVDPYSFGTKDHCWLRYDNFFVFSFLGPVIIIFLIIQVLLGFVFQNLFCSADMDQATQKTKPQNCKSKLYVLSGLFVTLVLAWTAALLFLLQHATVFVCLFCLSNIASAALFLLYVWKQNDKFRSKYANLLRGVDCLSPCVTQGAEKTVYYNSRDEGPIVTSNGTILASTATLHQAQNPDPNLHLEGGPNCAQPICHKQNNFPPEGIPHTSLMRQIEQSNIIIIKNEMDPEEYSTQSLGRDSGNGGSEQEESPRINLSSGNGSLRSSRRSAKRQFHTSPRLAEHLSPQTDPRYWQDHSVRRSRHSLKPPYPSLSPQGVRVRSGSPWNHTYTEIDIKEEDPVYAEIDHDRSGDIQVSDFSEEFRQRHLPYPKSLSPADHHPLISSSYVTERNLLDTISHAMNSPSVKLKHGEAVIQYPNSLRGSFRGHSPHFIPSQVPTDFRAHIITQI